MEFRQQDMSYSSGYGDRDVQGHGHLGLRPEGPAAFPERGGSPRVTTSVRELFLENFRLWEAAAIYEKRSKAPDTGGDSIDVILEISGGSEWSRRVTSAHPNVKLSARHASQVEGVPWGCDFRVCDLDRDWKVGRASQDLVMGVDILQNFSDPEAACQLALQALRPGGFLEIRDFSLRPRPPELRQAPWAFEDAADILIAAMRRAGFEDIRAFRAPIHTTAYADVFRDRYEQLLTRNARLGRLSPDAVQHLLKTDGIVIECLSISGQKEHFSNLADISPDSRKEYLSECLQVFIYDLKRASESNLRLLSNAVRMWARTWMLPELTPREVEWATRLPSRPDGIGDIDPKPEILFILGRLLELVGGGPKLLKVLEVTGVSASIAAFWAHHQAKVKPGAEWFSKLHAHARRPIGEPPVEALPKDLCMELLKEFGMTCGHCFGHALREVLLEEQEQKQQLDLGGTSGQEMEICAPEPDRSALFMPDPAGQDRVSMPPPPRPSVISVRPQKWWEQPPPTVDSDMFDAPASQEALWVPPAPRKKQSVGEFINDMIHSGQAPSTKGKAYSHTGQLKGPIPDPF